jgi:hypothetical protein
MDALIPAPMAEAHADALVPVIMADAMTTVMQPTAFLAAMQGVRDVGLHTVWEKYDTDSAFIVFKWRGDDLLDGSGVGLRVAT